MKSDTYVKGLVVLWTLAVGGAALAQDVEPTERATRRLESVPDTTLRSPIVAPTPVFIVESGTDETTANALWGVQYGDLTFSLKFTGPLKKGAATKFADLDGLRNKAAIDAGIGWLYWTAPDPAPNLAPACEKLAALRGDTNTGCTLQELRAAEKETGQALVPFIDPGTALFLTARAKGAREDIDFLDATTLEPASLKTSSSALTIAVGWLTRNNWMVGANYRHEDIFESADAVDVCRPIAGTNASRCTPAVIGVPRENKSELWQLEIRKFMGRNLAISPRLTRNITTAVTGFEFPLYFIKAGDGKGLTGGVIAGWRSDQRGPSVVLFVGQALGIWNR